MWNVDIITSAQESRKLQSPILGVSSDNHYNSSLSSLSGLVASCTVEPSDIALGFLYNCHEANELRFQYSLLLSPASYIIGEVLLIIGIDVIGRRLSIGKFSTHIPNIFLTHIPHNLIDVMSRIFNFAFSIFSFICITFKGLPSQARKVNNFRELFRGGEVFKKFRINFYKK